MSLESTNYLGSDCNVDNLYWVIEKLGYREEQRVDIPVDGLLKYYNWNPPDHDLTYVGIELSVLKDDDGALKVNTRARSGRSRTELKHQNNTIETIKNFFGGRFVTDSGDGSYFDLDESSPEETDIAMAMLIQRWKLHDAFVPIRIYFEFMDGAFHHSAPAGDIYGTNVGVLPLADQFRPCVISANILQPYIIGVWENYVHNSYLSILKYTEVGLGDINTNKLSKEDLDGIRKGEITVEECAASLLSFQKPKDIISNFNKLDKTLKINDVFNIPLGDLNLRESIENAVRLRNQIVHEGFINNRLTHDDIMRLMSNIETVANRLYEEFARVYGFDTNYDF